MLSAAANEPGVLSSAFNVDVSVAIPDQLQTPASDMSALLSNVRKRDLGTPFGSETPSKLRMFARASWSRQTFLRRFLTVCGQIPWFSLQRPSCLLTSDHLGGEAIQVTLVDVAAASMPVRRSPRPASLYSTTGRAMA